MALRFSLRVRVGLADRRSGGGGESASFFCGVERVVVLAIED